MSCLSTAAPRSRARSASAARRTSCPRPWSPPCSAANRAGCATCPTSATSGRTRPAAAARRHGPPRRRARRAGARPVARRERQRRRHRRARRLLPDPDPVLRPAAAPARPRLHPGPGRLRHRRPADRLPLRRAAAVRRDDREAGRRAVPGGAAAAARHQDPAAVPVRRLHRAGAADRRAGRGRHRAAQRRRRAGDRGPDLRAAEDGRDHLHGHRPDHPDHGRRPARRLHPPGAPGPHRGGLLGVARRWPPRATSTSAARSSAR